MAKYLQLYLDNDYIIPIGMGDSGNVNKYVDQQASRRMWLFFSNATSNGAFNSCETNKANAEAGKEGFYGDFWNHIAKADKVPGEPYLFIELLDLSGIISTLREWANMTLFTEAPEVVLHFSSVIPLKARRAFADYIEKKLGKIRSYSKEINDLLAEKVKWDNSTMTAAFGDQMLVIQSSGNDILLSVQTWCGEQFMQGDEAVRLKKKGSEFLKMELAKMVVDFYERSNNMLLQAQKEQEYIYQMQFTETWLKGRKGDNDFWVENFHYSQNPGKIYPPLLIDGKQLNLIEKEAIRNTINAISKYYSENIRNNHLHTILIGDIFREDIFLKDCVSVTSSDGKYTFFDDNAIQEALGRYNVKYSTLVEDLRDLERTYADKANERARIGTYVHNAEELGLLRSHSEEAEKKIKSAYDRVNDANKDLRESWEALMKQSDFDKAKETISKMSTSDELTIAKAEAIECLKAIERRNSLLIDLMQLHEVKDIVESIRARETTIRMYVKLVDDLREMPDNLSDIVKKYEDLRPKYLEIKAQFDHEPTLVGKRRLIEEMKALTMEPMPVVDVETIKGSISVKSESSGGFLGIGAKKVITIRLHIDKPLPCRCVLIIAPDVIINIPDGRCGVHCIDVDKGEEGDVIEMKTDLQSLGLSKSAKSFFIKFWPHEDEKVPINSFEIRGTGTAKV